MIRRTSRVGTGIALLLAAAPVFQQAGAQTLESENIVLGRPTDDSVAVHALADESTAVSVEYGEQPGTYSSRSRVVEANADDVAEITVGGLRPNTRYFYQVNYRGASDSDYRAGQQYSFHTQRSRGSTFTFGVQGDSHPERSRGNSRGDGMYHPDLYVRTMEQVASAEPDLYFMLGDDFNSSRFMANFFQGDKTALTQQIVDDVYLGQRRILSLMTNSTALFPVIGNHEEARRNLLGTKLHDAAIYAGRARVRMLPVPAPDSFYSGNPEPVEGIGLLRDYFAFTWGDALFIALSPYWHSPVALTPAGNGSGAMGTLDSPPWSELEEEWLELTLPANEDLWEKTMGDAQYNWLKKTLEESDARFKFVFAHHVLGYGRSGIERATLYEWGGHGGNGEWEFDERRPGWELPVHQLMVKHGVSIFFQGHDHLFAHQELDGIAYQTVGNPADENYRGRAKEFYLSGTILDNSGYLDVTVSPDEVQVDYVRSYLPQDETDDRRQGDVQYSYTIN